MCMPIFESASPDGPRMAEAGLGLLQHDVCPALFEDLTLRAK